MTHPIELQRETIEQIELAVSADADPTTTVVQWSFTKGDPATNRPGGNTATSTAWMAGAWKFTPATNRQGRFGAVAVSPTIGAQTADVPLSQGRWHAWVRISDNPETPVRHAGHIVVK